MIRGVFLFILGVHGLIHLLGFAKAFGLADLPQLAQPISRTWGALWLAAGMRVLAAAALLPLLGHLLSLPSQLHSKLSSKIQCSKLSR